MLVLVWLAGSARGVPPPPSYNSVDISGELGINRRPYMLCPLYTFRDPSSLITVPFMRERLFSCLSLESPGCPWCRLVWSATMNNFFQVGLLLYIPLSCSEEPQILACTAKPVKGIVKHELGRGMIKSISFVRFIVLNYIHSFHFVSRFAAKPLSFLAQSCETPWNDSM